MGVGTRQSQCEFLAATLNCSAPSGNDQHYARSATTRLRILPGLSTVSALPHAAAGAAANPAYRNPIIGIAGCCARAASGRYAIAPPISLMNSRRLMGAQSPGIAELV
jgi:hypothetical protein